MELCEMVFRRKSVRSFTDKPVGEEILNKLKEQIDETKPLYPQIGVDIRFVTKDQVRFYFPWKSPQLLAVFSENKPGYLENVGFIVQQLDLYLQSLGIGTCWLGLGKLRAGVEVPENMEFVILMAFGHTKDGFYRTSISQFKRKPLDEIMDISDDRLNCARVAPSSTNSQPWYFTHDAERIHVYRTTTGERRHKMLGYMNRIDMGIALSHVYVSCPGRFQFFQVAMEPVCEGRSYVGTIII